MKLYFQNKKGEQLAVDTKNRCYTFEAPRVKGVEIINVTEATMINIQIKLIHDHYQINWYGN